MESDRSAHDRIVDRIIEALAERQAEAETPSRSSEPPGDST